MSQLNVRGLTFRTPGILPEFSEYKFPEQIGENCLLVKIHAASLNPIDIKLSKFAPMRLIPGEKGVGKDFSGVVEKVGESLLNLWKEQDRVCGTRSGGLGWSTIASYVIVDVGRDAVMKVPKGLTDEEAAAFPICFGTAFQCLSRADPKLLRAPDSAICVLGGSTSVGLFAIQLAKKHFGVSKVVATCSLSSEPLVREIGADIIVDYKSLEKPSLGKEIALIASAKLVKKFAIVVDCVGGIEVLNHWPEILLPRSEGSAYSTILPWSSLLFHMPYTLPRFVFGRFLGINYSLDSLSPHGEWLKKAPQILGEGEIRIVVDSTYDWNNWKEAWTKVEKQRAHGKIVLKITQED